VDELKKPPRDLTTARKRLNEVEREHIVRVLEQTNWKVSGKNGASEILGLDRSTLRARIENWKSTSHKHARFIFCSLPQIITPSIHILARKKPHTTSKTRKIMVIYDQWSYITIIIRSVLSPLAVTHI